jgi:glycerol-3-phosphate dehydrogenase
MAEDVINISIQKAGLTPQPCSTEKLRVHGATENTDFNAPLYYYGSDIPSIRAMVQINPSLGELLHPSLPYIKAEIVWAVQNEMCMTVEDALSRRTRALLLDARASVEASAEAAAIMAEQMNKNSEWISEQVVSFRQLAQHYLPKQKT